MEFKPWAARHDATMQAFLRAMLARADADAKASLDPQGSGDGLTFRLREGLFTARKT
jgi:hypothetical protein